MASKPQNQSAEARRLSPIIEPGHTFASITDKISSIVLTGRTPRFWYVGFGLSFILVLVFSICIAALLTIGVGLFGIMIPVAWGFAIVNFVWWIGIGHAGTLISAILLLLRQKWRQSINRFAEAMTLFAVACAGLVSADASGPSLVFLLAVSLSEHHGHPAAVPQSAGLGRVCGLHLFHGFVAVLVPRPDSRSRDLARSGAPAHSALHLRHAGHGLARLGDPLASLRDGLSLLAGLATPLVVSVHTVVSFDFAVALVPGWHSTIFPPYFVAGAIYSGFAMVLTIAIPLRKLYGLEDFITMRHLKNMGMVMLATGMIVAYGYLMETFMAWYSGDIFEKYMMMNRMFGPYGWMYWLLILFNILIPQALWFRSLHTNVIVRCSSSPSR